jgi:hypothetical protein
MVVGSGRVVEEEFDLADFDAVELASSGDLVIELGDEERLRVEAEENLIPYLDIDVAADTLRIRHRQGVWLWGRRPMRFFLTVESLDTIHLIGSGDVRAPDLEGDRISIQITGSGDIETGELDAGEIELRITGSGEMDVEQADAEEIRMLVSGSGDIRVTELTGESLDAGISGSGSASISRGLVVYQKVTISGSGDYTSVGVDSVETEVGITGSGSAEIEADERLSVRISGSGDVYYAGSPAAVVRRVTGSGELTRIED